MKTLKQIKDGAQLDTPIYVKNPFVVLSNEGMVLGCGTLEEVKAFSPYFDDCRVDVRKYDLYLNDNTKHEWKHNAPVNPMFLGAQPARNGQDY